MKPITALALLCAGFAQIQPTFADTLRCGAALIEPGDDAAYVLEKCGEPNLPPPGGPGLAQGTYTNLSPGAVLRAGIWRYHRGPGLFPVVLVIGDDGRVESIQYDRHRDKGDPDTED